MENKRFELHAVVELFGHTRMAGKVSEQTIGSASFIRIDVPETNMQPAFTRIVNPSAVYAINPVTEEVAIDMAQRLDEKPINAWDIRKMQEKLMALKEPEREMATTVDDDDDLEF